MTPLLAAALGAPLVGFLAWRVRALTISGAVAAACMGFCHLGFGGWLAAGALLAFFGSSTALSKLGKRRKAALGFEKPGARDAWQVLANGGVAALCALGISRFGAAGVALLGALAAANADTWATELGSLFGGKPRRITNLAPAEPGESGAVSIVGTLAALAGAALLGAFAGPAWLAVTLGGLTGALGDSVLGATLQAQWWDEKSGRWSEVPQGRPTRGLGWLRNDAVNLLATLIGAVTAASLAHVLVH
jgi:uncharacterized protein (TIGR00297 family)